MIRVRPSYTKRLPPPGLLLYSTAKYAEVWGKKPTKKIQFHVWMSLKVYNADPKVIADVSEPTLCVQSPLTEEDSCQNQEQFWSIE